MSHLTPLESAVMDAMIWQMGDSVPDLRAQVAASSPGLRRNTGAGLYSQIVVDADRAIANLVLHVGWIFGLVLAGWALRYLHGKKGRAQMAALAETLDRNGAFQALKPN